MIVEMPGIPQVVNVFHGGFTSQRTRHIILHLVSISKPLQIVLKRVNSCNAQQGKTAAAEWVTWH